MRTKKTIASLQARIDQLEAQATSASAEPRTSRRGMLRLAGAAAVGGLAAIVTAEPVAAGVDGDVVLGLDTNAASAPTGIAMAAASTVYGLGAYETGLGALPGEVGRPAIFGHATGTAFTTGVAGVDADDTGSSGYGVYGQTQGGRAVYGEAKTAGGIGLVGYGPGGALRLLVDDPSTAPPTRTVAYLHRTLDADINNDVWYCYEAGTPGKWRKLAGPATAGAFHAIKPTRVYDSRFEVPSFIAAGSNRLVSVADERNFGVIVTANIVPAGATAVAANITITGTVGGFGYLAINPGGDLVEGASTINWSSAGQTIANGVSLTLNGSRELTVICGGGGGTNFIIDIAGYYL
jgi:hypothetical protein